MDPRYIDLSSELMFQAGVKGMSERSELIPCIDIFPSKMKIRDNVMIECIMTKRDINTE